jgi:hypothetical protein
VESAVPVVPHRFLFRFLVSVCRQEGLPRRGTHLLNLPSECALPDFGDLDDARPFGQLRAAWNPAGIGFSLHVAGKKMPFTCDLREPSDADGLQIWIDTRSTQTIHRASRFCHHFCFLPSGAGRRGDEPAALQLPIALAREDAPRAKPESLQVACTRSHDGYVLEAWIAAAALQGFEPESNPRLGFYYSVRDAELGEQFLTAGRELPFAHDPSLWSTLELVN